MALKIRKKLFHHIIYGRPVIYNGHFTDKIPRWTNTLPISNFVHLCVNLFFYIFYVK